MAEKRKLHAEIEKTLRRVEEGITDFDLLLDKAHEAVTSSQKEKIEGELKRDIKKLQRFRDQIKSWLSGTEVKDKVPLEDSRKAIEKEMEKFKACEKMFKIKAFSKEGLAQQAKINPHEAERERHRKWIREALDRLKTEADFKEAEVEKHKAVTKKGKIKTTDADKISELQGQIVRHRRHTIKLEQILRGLENETVDTTLLDGIKESLDCYFSMENDLESIDQYDSSLYDELGLVDSEGVYRTSDREADIINDELIGLKSNDTLISDTQTHHDIELIQTDETHTIPPVPPFSLTPDPVPISSTDSAHNDIEPSLTGHSSSSRGSIVLRSDCPTAPSIPAPKRHISQELQETTNGTPTTIDQFNSQITTASRLCNEETTDNAVNTHKMQQNLTTISNGDELTTRRSEGRANLNLLSEIIDSASQHIPTMSQRRHFRYYQPQTLWSNPPSSFPTKPLKYLSTPEGFSKLELDTLFFAFYHQQGTYQQYLASRELKKKSWLYHKKYLTWFQPQSGPKVVTDRFHRGTYAYFDSEAGWCSRIKNDFIFELPYLENGTTPQDTLNSLGYMHNDYSSPLPC